MTQNRINLSKEILNKKGTHCHICTGCGRCFDAKEDIQIITESKELEALIMTNREGHRLVVADIGTTTIAMLLYDIRGRVVERFVRVNPQTLYGADIVSRILAAECKDDADKMQQMVRNILEKGLAHFRRKLSEGESIRMIVAANPTMVYLLMGWDPAELGKAPFQASHLEAVETVIGDTSTIIVPSISAFVGGDIVAGMYAYDIWHQEKPMLLIDLGTNGELVLGNRDRILVTATAAGPAFEGGVNKGVWGSDMVGLIANLLETNIVDASGLLADPYFEDGVLIGSVRITQESIRAIQLAKGAIMAGIQVLIRKYGIDMAELDKVVLAGGFGYYLNPQQACTIGLLPEALLGKTVAGGNTALAGARQLGARLFQEDRKMEDLYQEDKRGAVLEIVNLADEKDFEALFFEAMQLKKQ